MVISGVWTLLLVLYLQPLRELRRDTNKLLQRMAFLEGQFVQFEQTWPIRPIQGGRRSYDKADDHGGPTGSNGENGEG